MEKFQKISSKIIMGLSVVWILLTATRSISVGQSYMFLGALGVYLGIQNIILLNMAQKTGELPRKISLLVEAHGHDKGIKQYVIVNILMYMIIGALAMIAGFSVL